MNKVPRELRVTLEPILERLSKLSVLPNQEYEYDDVQEMILDAFQLGLREGRKDRRSAK